MRQKKASWAHLLLLSLINHCNWCPSQLPSFGFLYIFVFPQMRYLIFLYFFKWGIWMFNFHRWCLASLKWWKSVGTRTQMSDSPPSGIFVAFGTVFVVVVYFILLLNNVFTGLRNLYWKSPPMTQSSGCPWTTKTSTQQTLIIKMWIKAENTQRPSPLAECS